ncbi:MAG TPA: helix-turn-helix domain-containing protein [Terriglobales bacterium]|nr:helix-turn-helix domain-containing protein [Terriglobales bacterium]
MPSFGEKLKKEREKRNITLDQISATTKISTRMLQALEEDKFNQLPGGIFNKGFVRAYSRCLGLDEDQTVADYLLASGEGPRAEPVLRDNDAPKILEKIRDKEPEKEQATVADRVRKKDKNKDKKNDKNKDLETLLRLESSAEAPPRQLPWGLFAAILLLIALALVLLNRRHEQHEKRLLNPSNAASKSSSVTAATSSGGVAREQTPEKAGAASTASAVQTTGRTSSVPSKTAQRSEQSSAPPAPGEFTVVIQAREDCWLSITADGKALSSELLAASTERTVRAQKEIVVKAGNAGGVDFQFNGKKVDIQADYGEVKTVTFGPAGMSRTAPPPTPQP